MTVESYIRVGIGNEIRICKLYISPQSDRVTEWQSDRVTELQTFKGTQYMGGRNFFVPDCLLWPIMSLIDTYSYQRRKLNPYNSIIILLKTIPLCIGMAWLAFQKLSYRKSLLQMSVVTFHLILVNKLRNRFFFLVLRVNSIHY